MRTFTVTPEIRRRMTSFADGEISIMLGDDAAANLRASLHLAHELRSSRRFSNVIYMNLPFSRNRFSQERKNVTGSRHDDGLQIYHLTRGRAAESVAGLEGTLKDPKRTAIIINSWELSSSSYRLREALIFALHALQLEYGVTVIVFAMSDPAKVHSRRLNRAGLGKLALAADSIISLAEEPKDEDADEVEEEVGEAEETQTSEILMLPEHVPGGVNQEQQAEEESSVGVNLPTSKNNNLPDAPRHLNRRERRRLERLATKGRV